MTRLLRLLIYATYPFLALSCLLLAGMMFGAAFVTDFTVVNCTSGRIAVTPVGTVGREGHKAPLPVKMLSFPSLPALRAGGFPLAPGEAITIHYDMDDINFSEIVVDDERKHQHQLITDPDPTANQYHGPLRRRYVIDDLSRLGPVSPAVGRAAEAADRQWAMATLLFLILLGPWLIYGVLTWLLRRGGRRAGPNQTLRRFAKITYPFRGGVSPVR
jgi:hypothetical protein